MFEIKFVYLVKHYKFGKDQKCLGHRFFFFLKFEINQNYLQSILKLTIQWRPLGDGWAVWWAPSLGSRRFRARSGRGGGTAPPPGTPLPDAPPTRCTWAPKPSEKTLFPQSDRTRLRSSRIQAQKALVRSSGLLRMRSKNLTDPVVEFYEGLRAEGGGRCAAGGGGEVGVAPEVARQPGQVAVAHQVVVSQLEAAQSEQRLEHVFSERCHVVVVQSAANAITIQSHRGWLKHLQDFQVFETFDGGVVDARQLVVVQLPELKNKSQI